MATTVDEEGEQLEEDFYTFLNLPRNVSRSRTKSASTDLYHV